MTSKHAQNALKKHILCIEDEVGIRNLLRYTLDREGYGFHEAENASQMKAAIGQQRPDLVLMDWMLPDESGIMLIKQLRSDPFTRDIPIIMITAKADEQNMIDGLDAGADDYITKPLSLKSLNARIKALLRRSDAFNIDDKLIYDTLELDLAKQTLSINGISEEIGMTELKLLKFFMQNPERVLSRAQLLDHVWGQNSFIDERTVDVHILRLRKILKKQSADQLLKTIRGSGYKLSF